MAQTPVEGSKIPVPALGIGLSLFAGYLKTSAGAVRTAGSDVKSAWSGMSAVYHAPEDVELFSVMDPVAVTADSFATDVEAVARALETFAAEAEPLQQTLRNAQGQATAFDAKVAGDGKWDHDGAKVKENNEILHSVNTALVAYQAAERRAANAIEALIGGHAWHVADPNKKHQDKYAYGYSSIPDNMKLPWGGKVSKKDGCFKSTLKGVGHFFEGAGESLWGMATGVVGLVNPFDWKKFKQSWQGLNTIVQLIDVPAGLAQYGPKGYLKRLTTVGKSLIDFNEWKTDPAKAAGNSITTVLTLAIPVAGEVSAGLDAAKAAKVAGDASDVGKAADTAGAVNDAGKLGKAGQLAKTAALNFSKYTDPFHYAGQLPKVVNVVKGLGVKIPDLLVVDSKGGSLIDHQMSGLDHTPTPDHTPTHAPEPAMTGAHTGAGPIDHSGAGTVDHSGTGAVDHNGTGSVDHGGTHDVAHSGSGSHPAGGGHSGSGSDGSGAGDHSPGAGPGGGHSGTGEPGHPAGHPAGSTGPPPVHEQIDKATRELSAGAQHWPATEAGDIAATAYGKAHWGDYVAHLPEQERAAVHDYSLEHETDPKTGAVTDPDQVTYTEINAQLRGQGTDNPAVLHDIAEIDKVMNAHPVPHDIVVTRGTNLNYLEIQPAKLVGHDLPQSAYTSTSLGRTPKWAGAQPYMMHIRVPEGTPAAYIGGASGYGDAERELLLGRGQTIHVDNVILDRGQWQVFGHIVPK